MSESDRLSFDLTHQPWLLARSVTGTTEQLSLVDVFRRAHELTGLLGDVPTQVFALTRLLLGVLHGATAGPRDIDEWEALWNAGTLPAETIELYLERHRERFDLFHPDTPFFQVAGLRTLKDETSELSKLIADVPNGHPFFTSRLGGALSLSFAEAARWVAHAQAFDPSGIKSGAAGDDRVKGGKGYPIGVGWSGLLGGVLPEGRTLKDTLLLNLIPRDYDSLARRPDDDLPVWERPAVGPAEEEPGGRAPTGPVDLYTWQSRRIRLVHDGDRVVRVLICNGERATPQNMHNAEPHTAWRRSKPQEKKLGRSPVYMPREHEPERAIWRGLQSLLPAAHTAQGTDAPPFLTPPVLRWVGRVDDEIGLDLPVRLRTISMVYGNQSSTTMDIIDDALSLHAVLLHQDAVDLAGVAVSCVTVAERAAKALGALASDLAAAAGCGRDEREGPRTRAIELAFAELDPRFRTWIAALAADTDFTETQIAWHTTVNAIIRDLGSDLINRAPAKAWGGRVVDKRRITTLHADKWFHQELRKALPLAYPAPAPVAS
ncbi:type I-E CRISPR-associated protein Cse1/CasA [Lentzea sp. NPDC003310]|uniref:type I-E CRISPR-associated protein Cse1/CasA n=1 Tax=Lentzea sp. NPDC003310 TaxID=3154447 RepID=UPI0033A680C2